MQNPNTENTNIKLNQIANLFNNQLYRLLNYIIMHAFCNSTLSFDVINKNDYHTRRDMPSQKQDPAMHGIESGQCLD